MAPVRSVTAAPDLASARSKPLSPLGARGAITWRLARSGRLEAPIRKPLGNYVRQRLFVSSEIVAAETKWLCAWKQDAIDTRHERSLGLRRTQEHVGLEGLHNGIGLVAHDENWPRNALNPKCPI